MVLSSQDIGITVKYSDTKLLSSTLMITYALRLHVIHHGNHSKCDVSTRIPERVACTHSHTDYEKTKKGCIGLVDSPMVDGHSRHGVELLQVANVGVACVHHSPSTINSSPISLECVLVS